MISSPEQCVGLAALYLEQCKERHTVECPKSFFFFCNVSTFLFLQDRNVAKIMPLIALLSYSLFGAYTYSSFSGCAHTKITCTLLSCAGISLTLSTPMRLKAACSTLKLWMNSCSRRAWNFTFFSRTLPGNSMSMNWQYATPARRYQWTPSMTCFDCQLPK